MSKVWSVQIGGWLRHGGVLDVDVQEVRAALKQHPACEITVTIEPAEARRSNASNRYLFGPVYDAIVEVTGQDKEDVHDEMCARFTTETISRVDPKSGEIVEFEVVRRTSGMKGSRFYKFVQDVKLFSSEFFGITFEDEPDDMRKEYERAKARDDKKATAA